MCNETIIVTYFWEMECLNCKTLVPQTPGKRPKLYCSETCRVAFFRQKKAGDGVKKGKGRPRKHIAVSPKKVYNAKKLPDTTLDEAGKYATAIDPHSNGHRKGKTVVYKKGSKKDPSSLDVNTKKRRDGTSHVGTIPEANDLVANFKSVKDPVSLDLQALVREGSNKKDRIQDDSDFKKGAKEVEIPYPKDWDKMGRIDKMKWLTANR